MNVSIIVIGDELLIGQVTDTNSGWIARHINPLGWKVKSIRTVADNKDDIKNAITNAFAEADLVLTTGGLGPTKDDITKATMLEIFGGKMILDKDVEKNVLEIFKRRNIKMNYLTANQAMVPSSCKVIQNKVGTAPIMWFEKDGKVLVSLPGVPYETETMMEMSVIPQLKDYFHQNEYIEHHTFVVIGYTESALAIRLEQFENSLPEYIKLAYLPKPGIIRLRLSAISTEKLKLHEDMVRLESELTEILGANLISNEDKTIEEILGDKLREMNIHISTAESCTGGNIAHRITSISGSSEYFNGSIVSYTNQVKMKALHVSKDTLEQLGAVSHDTVVQMAKGVSDGLNTECSIATSGFAGPGGGTDQDPVGTVWVAVKYNDNIKAEKFKFTGNRQRVIDRASTVAMIEMLKLILKL